MAEACKMKDPKKDPEETSLLEIILRKLEEAGLCDNLWDISDVYESSYSEMGYKRYHIDKKLIGKFAKTTTETEGHLHVTMCLFALNFTLFCN